MSMFILLSTLTEEGRKTIKQRPQRIKEVNKEVEQHGCRVAIQYAVLGDFDFVTIVEAPDNEAIAKMSLDLASRGTVRITSMPAFNVDDFIGMIQPGSAG